jgi:DNA mismatch repair protein MutS
VSFTPMIRQYLEIKKQYPDAILFFRLGDFYEMFFDDARLASRELEITLTGREGGAKERVPMCGIPYHASDTYIARLIAKKYRVAICEQVEDPSLAKGIVRREVIRVITPGTVMDGQLLEAKMNNYLASIAREEEGFSLAVTDITTGQFMINSFSGERAEAALLEELSRLMPAEIIVPLSEIDPLSKIINTQGTMTVNGYKDIAFEPDAAARALENQFGPDNLKTLSTSEARRSIPAAGALICFLKETQKRDLTHIREINYYQSGKYLLLDTTTRRNLELTRSIQDASRKNTLLSVLDYTVTAMGGRLIRNWIERPLLEIEKIESRLTAVEALVHQTLYRSDLKDELKQIYDLERLAGKISFGSANARDLVALKKSLGYLPSLKTLLEQAEPTLLQETGRNIDPMPEVRDLLNAAIDDDPPVSLRDGGIIKAGYNAEVDRLRRAGREAKTMLAGLEEREKARTGIKSLKVGFNKVFGYYIEITRSNLLELRDELLKPAPSWAVLREHMVWLILFGKKEFFSILPFIVLYVRKIAD